MFWHGFLVLHLFQLGDYFAQDLMLKGNALFVNQLLDTWDWLHVTSPATESPEEMTCMAAIVTTAK
jgi:hypothetical protein